VIVSFLTDTVTRLRATSTTDRYGNTVPGTVTETSLVGVAVLPPGGQLAASTENDDGRDHISVFRVLFASPGTDITATDQIRHGGRTYDVVGEPAVWTVGIPHIEVNLRVVTG
jgi:hypothetical protein